MNVMYTYLEDYCHEYQNCSHCHSESICGPAFVSQMCTDFHFVSLLLCALQFRLYMVCRDFWSKINNFKIVIASPKMHLHTLTNIILAISSVLSVQLGLTF